MENNEEPGRKYRLNKKKFTTFILALGFTVAFIAVAVVSLANADIKVTGTGTSAKTSPSTPATKSPKQNGAQPSQSNSPSNGGAPTKSGKSGGTVNNHTVLVDAGHGGFDPGAIGKDGTYESTINLAVAKALKTELESRGAKVIMTRSDKNAIADTKEADMAKRQSIIKDCGSDIVISIHMNSMKDDTKMSGPLVLFMPGSDQGKSLAGVIQKRLNDALGSDSDSRSENLLVLRSGNQPAVLVECGYISNPNEAKKLKTSDYQQKLAKAICDGADDFFAGK